VSEQQAPDFTAWDTDRLAAHLKHLDRLILISISDPTNPRRPRLKAEREAVRAALAANANERQRAQ
jgi:hypothetical protein